MKKSKWRFIPLVIAILSGLELALEGILRLLMHLPLGQMQWDGGSAASAGIIGGADGPTVIFITSSTNDVGLILTAVVFVVSVFVYIYLRKGGLQKH